MATIVVLGILFFVGLFAFNFFSARPNHPIDNPQAVATTTIVVQLPPPPAPQPPRTVVIYRTRVVHDVQVVNTYYPLPVEYIPSPPAPYPPAPYW